MQWLERYAGYRVAASVVKAATEADADVIDDDAASLDPADEDAEPEAAIEPDEVVAKSKPRKAKTVKHGRVADKSLLLTDVLPPVPPRGPFQVSNVRKSTYFFS